jgi:predicted dinucleotide-binding enzyme
MMGFDTSGAERIAALAPRAHVFKTFNQTGFENLADARAFRQKPAMFVAGDDAPHKPTVLRLVSDAGFDAIDVGSLRSARLLEPLAMLWIELARKRGMGSGFAFALERKG